MLIRARLALLPTLLLACSSSKPSEKLPREPATPKEKAAPTKEAAPAKEARPREATPSAHPASPQHMDIVPGSSLGPLHLGMKRADLTRLGMPADSSSADSATKTEIMKVGPYGVSLCAGQVEEIWLDDLRLGPKQVRYKGEIVARDTPRETFIGLFSDCEPTPPRTGGSFTQCEGGGIRIGYGMGDFLQVRVGRRGSNLDDDCTHILDDGSPVPVDAPSLKRMVEGIVDIRELSDYWHVREPGRKPLRIVGAEVLGGMPSFNKFGQAVVYVTAEQAKADALPVFEFSSLTSSQTQASIEFRYDVEGVVGSAQFVKRYGVWERTNFSISER